VSQQPIELRIPTFQQQAVLWGQVYEVLVKRGVLACLVETGLLSRDLPSLRPWIETRVLDVQIALVRGLGVIDENGVRLIDAAVEHLALSAYGLGYTAMREYLKPLLRDIATDRLRLRALWCPLTLPGTGADSSAEGRAQAFHTEFGLSGFVDVALADKGKPANSDFSLWLSGQTKEDHLLVQEYSFDMPRYLGDFRDQKAHLDELSRHRRLLESRGVFAAVSAEVAGEGFELSNDIAVHLSALTSQDKPLFKLCQASGYAESTVNRLQGCGLLTKPCVARALAVTPNGLESLAARFADAGAKEPRRVLMEQFGTAYRDATKIKDGDDAELTGRVRAVFRSMLNKLPPALKDNVKGLEHMPEPGQDYSFEFQERVPEFTNPSAMIPLEVARRLIDDTKELQAYLGAPAPQAIGEVLQEFAGNDSQLSLRDLHASAVVAGLRRAARGRLNVLALEGNPGIGKTTAVRRYLEKKGSGFLFLYVSPRVVINRDVTESLGRKRDGSRTGVMTITSNATLIASAERWHLEQVKLGLTERRRIDGAVVVDGVANLQRPNGSIIVIEPSQEAEIERIHAGSRMAKMMLSENEDLVQERSLVGVLSGMATTTRDLLQLNPGVNRVVMTAALQGYRSKGGDKTTMQALSHIFFNKAVTSAGHHERREFARRIPEIIVMVDELAGDGAGAPFVHGVARWLHEEFLDVFEDAGEPCPFSVTLVISDASLGNEVVLDRYLNAAGPGERAPDKILVARSAGESPFRLAATNVRIGGRPFDVMHVMTNSFPASRLDIRYRVRMTSVRPEINPDGTRQSARQAMRKQGGEALVASATSEIVRAVERGAAQVIYFAQDKLFLSDLQQELAKRRDLGLSPANVEVLDSSVPGSKRKQLISEQVRDTIKVFLMTSSGARGVSFPRTEVIIAAVPRFSVEASLMEIAQLIYRGRGSYKNEHGEDVSGDDVPRELIMLVDDFLVDEDELGGGLDQRQWLRRSLDLLTLLVMLRATILTRITGNAGLKQSLALVPVGAVGLEELVSIMSQSIVNFISEAEVFCRRGRNEELSGLVKNAQSNVIELFSQCKLRAIAQRNKDCRTMVRAEDIGRLSNQVCTTLGPLLVTAEEGATLPEHVYFSGPSILENWESFDKHEAFTFEGHRTRTDRVSKALIKQLYAIDKNDQYPSSLREPALNLFRILQRENAEAANEFSTLKELKSPNTWICLPTGYLQFLHTGDTRAGVPFQLREADVWMGAMAKTLQAGSAFMPPIAQYESFPWAATVGQPNPLKLHTVFNDRYFMASNELNLLNTLLLLEPIDDQSAEAIWGRSTRAS
jgi:ethanolamine utilization microcompartment shell protein EutS